MDAVGKVSDAFRDFASGDGLIDKRDLVKIFTALGWDSSEIDALFRCMKMPDGGRISYDKFVNWVFRSPPVECGRAVSAATVASAIEAVGQETYGYSVEASAAHSPSKSDREESDSGSSFGVSSEEELEEEPQPMFCTRRFGVSAEATGAFNGRFVAELQEKYPYHAKSEEEQETIMKVLVKMPFLRNVQKRGVQAVCDSMGIQRYAPGDPVYTAGEDGRNSYIIVAGAALSSDHNARTMRRNSIPGRTEQQGRRAGRRRVLLPGQLLGMSTMLWGAPHEETVSAKTDLVVAVLRRHIFYRMVTIHEMEKRTLLQVLLRKIRLFEFLSDDKICRLADVLQRQEFKADDAIYKEGDRSNAVYLVWDGFCSSRAIDEDGDEDILKEYQTGDYFGAECFQGEVKRPNHVVCTTKCKVMVLPKRVFERMLGVFKTLEKDSLIHDPRTAIADWCAARSAFMICRPTSRDAIAKMIDGRGVGKGLNVKGKSSLLNILSGFVPFLQISDNDHKQSVEASPPRARLRIYFRSRWARELARRQLIDCLKSMEADTQQCIEGDTLMSPVCPDIVIEDSYATSNMAQRQVYGLDVRESVVREAYIMQPDIGFRVGWETGRTSEPILMNMNLHALRSDRSPKVVLYQFDQLDPMNPQGLLIAYAEEFIMPVVSDFDVFTLGMKGQKYEQLEPEQQSIAMHMLNGAESIMKKSVPGQKWNSRWLQMLQTYENEGYHPHIPQYGFGDPTSAKHVEDIVNHTLWTGAVRHGPECFNLYSPQELDAEYLILWEGFDAGCRWKHVDESGLQEFLSQRLSEAFSFPVNPVWPCRDKGWYELYERLKSVDRDAFDSWFPPDSGLQERIIDIHASFPSGFIVPPAERNVSRKSTHRDTLRPRRMSAQIGALIPTPMPDFFEGDDTPTNAPLMDRVLRRASFKASLRMSEDEASHLAKAFRRINSL